MEIAPAGVAMIPGDFPLNPASATPGGGLDAVYLAGPDVIGAGIAVGLRASGTRKTVWQC
jgi:hypothetical protein